LKEPIIVVKSLLALCKKKELTLSCAESFTGGAFATTITNVPGASQVFLGGVVAYHNQAKIDLLQIDPSLLEEYGAISEACAKRMADQSRTIFHSDLAISFTGNAGPTSQEGKPVGLVYLGFSTKNKTVVHRLILNGTRSRIRKQSIALAIEHLFAIINEV
jgi:nicotinamide-nucleotide amidase